MKIVSKKFDGMVIDTALKATGFVFAVYFLAVIISLCVAGMIALLSHLLMRGRRNETEPSQKAG